MKPKPKNEEWKKRLEWAKFTLVQSHPFFAVCLLNLRVIRDDSIPTMATDGMRILFNAGFVNQMTDRETMGVLAHEIMHVLGLHMLRKGHRKHQKWNMACDHAINAILEDARFELPAVGCPPIRGKTPEEIYETIPDPPEDWQSPGDVQDPAGEGGRPLTQQEASELESKVKVLVKQAVNAAKQAGKLPAGLDRMVDELTEPKIPWRDVLSRFITEKALNDWSWARPNRRYQHMGVILPSPDGVTISRGAVACDTSGSMDQAQLVEVCSEALALLSMYESEGAESELDIYWFDHAAHHQRVASADEIKPVGGGGTSFACVFEKMKELKHRPSWLVLLTDGYCDDFGEDPGFPVLWILTQNRTEKFQPPFGEVAHLL